MQLAKVYNETILVPFLCQECKLNGPVVTVNILAMTAMERLPVCERDIIICFTACYHGLYSVGSFKLESLNASMRS